MKIKQSLASWLFLLSLFFLIAFLLRSAVPLFTADTASTSPWKSVEAVFGKPGSVTGRTIKFGFPRTDLSVTLNRVALKPALALGSWVAFTGSADSSTMMGDLVLLQNEVEPVVDALESGGVLITALHNHLLHETPHVMYLHYMGHGNAETLAKTLKTALSKTSTPLGATGSGKVAIPPQSNPIHFDVKKVESILGRVGAQNSGVLSFGIPRAEPILEHGMEVPTSMGVANSINLQDAPSGVAATGDFVLVASEVNPVLHALRSNGIAVTALHNHMLDDNPRLFFMHFWGQGDATKIATGLKSALEKINIKK